MVQTTNASMVVYTVLLIIGMYILYYSYVNYCNLAKPVPVQQFPPVSKHESGKRPPPVSRLEPQPLLIPSEYETEVQRRVQAEVEKIMAQSEGCIEQCLVQSKTQARGQAKKPATTQSQTQTKNK